MPERLVYMDNNATTPLHPRVKEAMAEALELFGNASSLHGMGREARRRVEAAREAVAAFIGAVPEEIVFVGSGSEGNNTVLNITACSGPDCEFGPDRAHGLITSAIEHPCVLQTSKCLAHRGVDVRFVGVDGLGRVRRDELAGILRERPAGLVSVMAANNEIGTIQDVAALAALAHESGALFHTDAVQAVGKIPVDVADLGVDFLTLSAHKIYGPKGVGALYVKRGTPFCPLIRGGHQEMGRRAGTENTLGIIGLGTAASALRDSWESEARELAALRDLLWAGIRDNIPEVSLNGDPDHLLPGTLNVTFRGVEGEAILLYLDLEGIEVSTGSACSSGSLEPSHVLLALGLEAEAAHGSIRFSLGRENSRQDVEYVLEKLPPVIERLRKMSTAY